MCAVKLQQSICPPESVVATRNTPRKFRRSSQRICLVLAQLDFLQRWANLALGLFVVPTLVRQEYEVVLCNAYFNNILQLQTIFHLSRSFLESGIFLIELSTINSWTLKCHNSIILVDILPTHDIRMPQSMSPGLFFFSQMLIFDDTIVWISSSFFAAPTSQPQRDMPRSNTK